MTTLKGDVMTPPTFYMNSCNVRCLKQNFVAVEHNLPLSINFFSLRIRCLRFPPTVLILLPSTSSIFSCDPKMAVVIMSAVIFLALVSTALNDVRNFYPLGSGYDNYNFHQIYLWCGISHLNLLNVNLFDYLTCKMEPILTHSPFAEISILKIFKFTTSFGCHLFFFFFTKQVNEYSMLTS